MLKKIVSAFGGLSLAAFVTAAHATPVTTAPEALSVNGNVQLVFIGSDAGDTSYLSLVDGLQNIFCNHTTSSCTAAHAGDTVDLGTLSGDLVFQLRDITVPKTFDTENTSSDGYYHAKISTNYTDLGVFSIPSAAADAIAAILTSDGIVRYIGFEDRLHGDYDYNDFVLAVIDPPRAPIPEPASLFILGAGLAGIAAKRRRR